MSPEFLKAIVNSTSCDDPKPSTSNKCGSPTKIKICKDFHDDLEAFLIRDEDFKDFTIKIENSEFKIHKILFVARSETFAEMIKENPDADELILQDIPVEIFEEILKFLYTDETPKNPENAREIFSAAGKLKIKKLKEISSKILIEELENENKLSELWKIFNLGVKFEHEEMKLKAFEEIKKNFPDKNLSESLMDDLEKFNKIIKAKLMLDELIFD